MSGFDSWVGVTWHGQKRTAAEQASETVAVHRDGRVSLFGDYEDAGWTMVEVSGPITALRMGAELVGVARTPDRIITQHGVATLDDLIAQSGGPVPTPEELAWAAEVADEALGGSDA